MRMSCIQHVFIVFNMYSLPFLKKDLKLSSYHESISASSRVTEFLFHLFTCFAEKKKAMQTSELCDPYPANGGKKTTYPIPSMYDIIYFPRFLVDFDGNFM